MNWVEIYSISILVEKKKEKLEALFGNTMLNQVPKKYKIAKSTLLYLQYFWWKWNVPNRKRPSKKYFSVINSFITKPKIKQKHESFKAKILWLWESVFKNFQIKYQKEWIQKYIPGSLNQGLFDCVCDMCAVYRRRLI